MKKSGFVLAGLFWLNVFFSGAGLAEESVYELVIKDHRFSPAILAAPANQKIRITVNNEDATPEEFESYALNREKVVAGNSRIVLFVGPLKPGVYKFFGDFHQDTAQGVLEVK